MVFLARICKKNMLAPEKRGLASELFLVLSTPVYIYIYIYITFCEWHEITQFQVIIAMNYQAITHCMNLSYVIGYEQGNGLLFQCVMSIL
jgi:hypothetical protein